MTSENNSLLLNLQEVDKTTGEVVKLDVNSTSTVQPVALMRLGPVSYTHLSLPVLFCDRTV